MTGRAILLRSQLIKRDLDSLSVSTVGGVDGDLLALVDEERNHDLCTGLKGDLLEGAGGSGVTLDCRLSICDLEGYVCREFAGEALLLRLDDEHHLDMLTLLHEVGVVDDIVRKMDLLVGLLVHEVETILIGVKELVRTPLDIDDIDLGTCCEGVLKDTTVLEVAELCLDESRALAWFDMLEIDHLTWLAVEADVESVLEICCCCHINCVLLIQNVEMQRICHAKLIIWRQ